MTKTKKNLFKSLGFGCLNEDEFNQAITESGKIIRKKCAVDVVADEHGTYITSGPVRFWVSKNGRFACEDGPQNIASDVTLGNADVRELITEGKKTIHFKLFNNSKPYMFKWTEFCKQTFITNAGEVSGGKFSLKSMTGKDNSKLKNIALMLSKLVPPPKKAHADLVRILMHYVWKTLDAETLNIAINISGYGANSFDFSLIGTNLEEVRGIYKRTPGVLPVWIAKKYREFNADRNADNLLVMKQDLEIYLPSSGTIRFSYKTDSIVNEAKKDLADMTADSNKVWKYICKLKPRWSRTLATKGSIDVKGRVYNDLADISDLPKYTVLRDFLMHNYDLYGYAHLLNDDVNRNTRLAFLRAAFKESLKKPAKTFWNNEASLVWDWLSRERIVLDANQQRASWQWFMRMQQTWHNELNERLRIQRERREAEIAAKEAARKHKWDSLIESFEKDGYAVTPLLTTESLMEEGKEMHHCVATYSESCEDGISRIFSIKQGDNRLSTLEIIRDSDLGLWRVNQHRGPSNQDVSKELKDLAQFILHKYNRAYDKIIQEQEE